MGTGPSLGASAARAMPAQYGHCHYTFCSHLSNFTSHLPCLQTPPTLLLLFSLQETELLCMLCAGLHMDCCCKRKQKHCHSENCARCSRLITQGVDSHLSWVPQQGSTTLTHRLWDRPLLLLQHMTTLHQKRYPWTRHC